MLPTKVPVIADGLKDEPVRRNIPAIAKNELAMRANNEPMAKADRPRAAFGRCEPLFVSLISITTPMIRTMAPTNERVEIMFLSKIKARNIEKNVSLTLRVVVRVAPIFLIAVMLKIRPKKGPAKPAAINESIPVRSTCGIPWVK